MTVDLPVRIFIDSSDPDELAGISADLLSTVRQMRGKVTKNTAISSTETSVADRCRSVTGMGQKVRSRASRRILRLRAVECYFDCL